MARYRIGESIETGAHDANDSLLLTGTAIFGLLTGIGFVMAGVRAGIFWLIFWGAGLVISSLAYLIYPYL